MVLIAGAAVYFTTARYSAPARPAESAAPQGPVIVEPIVATNTPVLPPITIIDPAGGEATVSVRRYTITGTVSEAVAKISVKSENGASYFEHSYLSIDADRNWSYIADERYTNLATGTNVYIFTAYSDDRQKIGTATATIMVSTADPASDTVTVEWFSDLRPAPITPELLDEQIRGGKTYAAGTLRSGQWSGETVYLVEVGEMGGSSFYHLIGTAGEYRTPDELGVSLAGIDDLPETITHPTSGQILHRYGEPKSKFDDFDTFPIVFTDPKLGPIRLTCWRENKDAECDGRSCLMAELPDHRAVGYDFETPFPAMDRPWPIRFVTDDRNSQSTYNYLYPTCGSTCESLDIIPAAELGPDSSLRIAGYGPNDAALYEPADPEHGLYRKLYEAEYTRAWYDDDYKPLGRNRYSYEEFVALHPLLFWRDPIGRWVKLTNNKFATMAEMCKPVIYLYPERETDVTVKVAPNGGFTLTEPRYSDGWHVIASQDGRLTTADGNTYPYLFWEGVGENLAPGDRGTVVARADLAVFFTRSLQTLGLRGREIEDFSSYWIERLSGHDRWFLSFIDRQTFDRTAPLTVEPRPDTVIRVFLAARPVDKDFSAPPQTLKPVQRYGFSVIEWGGAVFE